jgi:hypothetical protein
METLKLPFNVIKLILSKINDTQTYLNSRLVCKIWYEKLKNIKIYNLKELKEIIEFQEKEITTYNSQWVIINKYFVKTYGGFIYKTYSNGQCIETINLQPPYKIKKKTLKQYKYTNVEYDINECKEIKTEETIEIPNLCIIT